ncbi:MAG TPA: cation:proton antiporter [Longimicrobiales bacterium]|nr:cation:proton antiporter [Longimicrobiales bacterium]
MTDLELITDLGTILAAAAILLLVARAVHVPSIVAYILAGLFLGPATGLVHATGTVELISEVGIALLLFLVGLELSIEKIRAVGRAAVVTGLVQVAVSTALGTLLGLALGVGLAEAAFVGLALSFSSTVVVVKLLERSDELGTLHGRLAVGVLLVQDLVVAVTLTLLAGLGASGEELGPGMVAMGVARASVGMMALVAIAIAGARWVLPRAMGWMGRSLEGLFIWSLTWCFGFILLAEVLQLSVEIGAFVAGVSLAQLAYNHELIRRVNPLVDFFLAVFFVSLGVHLDAAAAARVWPMALAFTAFVLLLKPVLVAVLVSRFGYGSRPSFMTGVLLGQGSEFSFIMVALGASIGMVGGDVVALVALTGLLSIGASSGAIQAAGRLYHAMSRAGLLRLLRGEGEERPAGTVLAGHVVVVGMNTLGRRLVEGLTARGELVLAVDTDPRKLAGLPCPTLLGNTDHPAVLEEAGVPRAKLVVSALQIEDANALLTYRTARMGVPVSVHAFDPSLVEELRSFGATHLMVSKYDGIRQVAEALRRAGVMG